MERNLKKHNSAAGFTLVELSIVLVIIGLIVGGILVGQDLIAAAKINAEVSLITKFETGATAFQAKYGARPGDIIAPKATAFGLAGGGGSAIGGGNVGNGNGVIDDQAGANTWTAELPDFFNHLTEAALIPGVVTDNIPATRIGKGYWTVGSRGSDPVAGAGSLLYFFLTDTGPAPGGSTVAPNTNGIFTPAEAFGFDNKSDDGLPDSGQTRALDPGTIDAPVAAVPTATNPCTVAGSGGAPNEYNLAVENNNCGLFKRSQG